MRDRLYLLLAVVSLVLQGLVSGCWAPSLPLSVNLVGAAIDVTAAAIGVSPAIAIVTRNQSYEKCLEGGGDEPSSAHIFACCERWLKPNGSVCAKGTDP